MSESKPIPKFNAGDVLYTRRGNKVEYITKTPQGHAVSPFRRYHGDDEEECPDGVITVGAHDLYREPPVDVVAPEIERLEQLIAERQQQLAEVEGQVRAASIDRKNLSAKLSQHKALKHIDDILEGRLAYFVQADEYGSVKVVDGEKALASNDRYGGKFKLLTLFGDTKGELQWRINSYGDGSGSNNCVYPFVTLEEAQDYARGLVTAGFEAMRKNGRYGWIVNWLASAKALGMEAPEDLVEMRRQQARKEAQARFDKASADAQKAREELAAMDGGQPA